MKNYTPLPRTNPCRAAFSLAHVAATLLGAALLAALLGSHLARGSSSAAPVVPTVDPRLVLHAHRVPLAGTLAGRTLRGSLYPGFPGANTIQLAAPERTAGTRTSAAHLDLIAVMPGMRMVPARARLQLREGVYGGVIALPMFGTYRARLTLGLGGPPQHGTVQLSLPLTLGG